MSNNNKRSKEKYERKVKPLLSIYGGISNDTEDLFQESLEREMGYPPYESIDPIDMPEGSLKRSKRRNHIKNKSYSAKYPYPNYYNQSGTIEYIDQQGREYSLATYGHARQMASDSGNIGDESYREPELWTTNDNRHGMQVFFIRIPIRLRGTVDFPSVGDKLNMIHIKKQVPCSGIVQSIFHSPRGKSGYLELDDFVSGGVPVEPERYNSIVDMVGKKNQL
jgi:hypothetical protein